jgi:RimJ/RimL family protein N-acetyltransferase
MESLRHIGNVSLQNINYIDRNAEIAYIIGEKEYWGKGFAREATELMLKHAFCSLNLERIYCGTSEKNFRMQGLAKRMHFIEEGIRRKAIYNNGQYENIIEYGILREEYFKYFNQGDLLNV